MIGRAILWITGAAAVLLYVRVGYFAFSGLGPHLACQPGPEMRFWGYGTETFARCFVNVPDEIIVQYQTVLLGADRLLAVALASFLALWAVRARVWIAASAAVAYGVSDWFENTWLVSALAGDMTVVWLASVLTMSKFACLCLAVGALIRAARHNRSA